RHSLKSLSIASGASIGVPNRTSLREGTLIPGSVNRFEIREGDALAILLTLPAETIQCCITSPPYWGLRDYGVAPQVWGGDRDHEHVWGSLIKVNATNHTDQRRCNHARNGRGEGQPPEKRPGWKRRKVGQGSFCSCGAWRGSLGLEPTPELYIQHI